MSEKVSLGMGKEVSLGMGEYSLSGSLTKIFPEVADEDTSPRMHKDALLGLLIKLSLGPHPV